MWEISRVFEKVMPSKGGSSCTALISSLQGEESVMFIIINYFMETQIIMLLPTPERAPQLEITNAISFRENFQRKHFSTTYPDIILLPFCKGKANPLQAWTSLEGSKWFRLSDFKTIST
jgi:hypothetical protein